MADTVAAPRELLHEILEDGTCPLHIRMQLQRLLGVVPVTVPVAAVPPAARRGPAPPLQGGGQGVGPAQATAVALAALEAAGSEVDMAEAVAAGRPAEESAGEAGAPGGEGASGAAAAEAVEAALAAALAEAEAEVAAAEAATAAVEVRTAAAEARTAAAEAGTAAAAGAEAVEPAEEAAAAGEGALDAAAGAAAAAAPEGAAEDEDAEEFEDARDAEETDEEEEERRRAVDLQAFRRRETEYLQAIGPCLACAEPAGPACITDCIGPLLPLVAARLPLADILAVRTCSSAGLEWAMERRTQRLGELARVHDRIRSRLWIQRLFLLNQGSADETVYETKVRSLADDAQRKRMEAEMAETRRDMEVQIRNFQQEVDRRMDLQAERVHAIVEERVQQQLDAIMHAEMEKVRTMVEDHVQGRVRSVVQREVRATVCEMQVRLARLARENDRLRAAFLEQLDHSNMCLRFMLWARSTNTTTGLIARALWAARRRLGAWLLGVSPDGRRLESLRSRLETFGEDDDGEAAAAASAVSRAACAALRSAGAAGDEDSPLDAMAAIAMLCSICRAAPRAQQARQQQGQPPPPAEAEGAAPAWADSGSEEAEAEAGAGAAGAARGPSPPPPGPAAPAATAAGSEAEGIGVSGASEAPPQLGASDVDVSVSTEVAAAPSRPRGDGEEEADGDEGTEDNAEDAVSAGGFGLVEPSDDEEDREELLRQAVREDRRPAVPADGALRAAEPAAAAPTGAEAAESSGRVSAACSSDDQAGAASEDDLDFQETPWRARAGRGAARAASSDGRARPARPLRGRPRALQGSLRRRASGGPRGSRKACRHEPSEVRVAVPGRRARDPPRRGASGRGRAGPGADPRAPRGTSARVAVHAVLCSSLVAFRWGYYSHGATFSRSASLLAAMRFRGACWHGPSDSR
ncbi:unnamed protein product [Prorocentrum cordatum]|uniref:Uncharacterized protein n=1 Tax=Prorocentrum cordatum TaxID=2364126 RepID=A0ABN9RX63_9DINO|nr:unnamed protein product [Polarella glacialis]